MTKDQLKYGFLLTLLLCMFEAAVPELRAQETATKKNLPKALQRRMSERTASDKDSISNDSLLLKAPDSFEPLEAPVDTALFRSAQDTLEAKPYKSRKAWIPNSSRATWLATIFPGAGQIYNRKYWKLPIIYGGFAACVYALNWNNQMYKDYSQAYLDIMDNNPNTNSYLDFFSPGAINNIDIDRLKTLLKNRKDSFRRNRDLSIFIMIGVYALSIIDAYVDAELSDFDISKDLSFKIEPTIINDDSRLNRGNSFGLQCSLKF